MLSSAWFSVWIQMQRLSKTQPKSPAFRVCYYYKEVHLGRGGQGIFVLIVLYRRVVNRKCAFACAFILPLLLNNYSFAHRTVDDKRGNIFNLLVSCVGLEKLGVAIKEAIVECLMLQMCKIGINRRHEVEIESQRFWYLLKSNRKDIPGP